MKRILLLVLCLLLSGPFLLSQQILPVISDIEYKIISDTLNILKEPQNITISILNQSQEKVRVFKLKFENVKVRWTPVRGSLNSENLWLIQSNESTGHSNVLAWNYDSNNNDFIFYQSDWETPFNLELELQVNLLDISSSRGKLTDNVVLEATTNNGIYSCNSPGRSNTVYFK
jgi:hypothetical protein